MAETSDHISQAPRAQGDEPHLGHLDSDDSPARVSGDIDRDAREDTELARLRRNYSRVSSHRPQGSSTTSKKPSGPLERFTYVVSGFWRHQISITVEHRTCRDHLALERTFLSYLRTSLALSMIGVTIAQLFRLQHAPQPNAHFGFFVLGKPLSCICQGAAIYTLAIGSFRTWRSQNAMVRGKAISGGFEIVLLAGGVFLLLTLFLALLITIDIEKENLG